MPAVNQIAVSAARSGSGSTTPNTRLAGIDGLRAVAALWVVLFHIQAFTQPGLPVPGLDMLLRSGSTGVSLFLVLSGFCLYVPFAGGRGHRFKTGQFFLRRCRRLLPAYYASLVFALLLSLLAGTTLGFEHLSPGQAAWQFITHATLIHTFFPSTFYALNGAYWSLGLECQLYLALPILILGIRRFGLPKTAAAAIGCNVVYRLALAVAIHRGLLANDGLGGLVLPNLLPGRWAEFIFGMIAAELYAIGAVGLWAGRLKWTLLALVPAGFLMVNNPLNHILFGGVFFIVLSLVLAANNVVSRILSWRPLAALGLMSYSLYLVHQPVIQGLAFLVKVHGHASPNHAFAILLLLLPFVVLLAWLLFMAVESRTLTSRSAVQTSAGGASRRPALSIWRPWLTRTPGVPTITD